MRTFGDFGTRRYSTAGTTGHSLLLGALYLNDSGLDGEILCGLKNESKETTNGQDQGTAGQRPGQDAQGPAT